MFFNCLNGKSQFNRLAEFGIIDHIPRCGWKLRPFTQDDLDAFLDTREVLELKALGLAKGRLDDKKLKIILNGNVLPKNSELPKVDNSLHSYIIEKARNRYIKDFFEHYGKYYEILFDWEDSNKKSAIRAAKQHRAILRALLKKDWRAAKKAMVYHIRNNHEVLKNINPENITFT